MSATMLAPEDITSGAAPVEPEEVDPEAPYGRKANGEPYKRSPEWRARTSANLRQVQTAAQITTAAAERARGNGKSSSKTSGSKKPDYTPGIAGLLQIPAFALGMLGPISPAFQLDAAALVLHTPTVASALNAAAQDNDDFAALLDNILKVGPWGAVLGALLPLALQLAANHGFVPAGPQTGTLTGDQLLVAMQSMQTAAQQAAAAAAAAAGTP